MYNSNHRPILVHSPPEAVSPSSGKTCVSPEFAASQVLPSFLRLGLCSSVTQPSTFLTYPVGTNCSQPWLPISTPCRQTTVCTCPFTLFIIINITTVNSSVCVSSWARLHFLCCLIKYDTEVHSRLWVWSRNVGAPGSTPPPKLEKCIVYILKISYVSFAPHHWNNTLYFFGSTQYAIFFPEETNCLVTPDSTQITVMGTPSLWPSLTNQGV